MVANVPYFAAVSANASTANYLLLRLDNGTLLTGTSGGAASTAPNGTFVVGNDFSAGDGSTAFQTAAMASGVFLSMPALVAWAADPWSFWYPPGDDGLVSLIGMVAAAAGGGGFPTTIVIG